MSISSALNAGVAGLSAQSNRLATISDNIANSSTYGYKRVDTEFDDMVLTQRTGGGIYSAGGVRTTTVRDILQSGSLVGTSNALDLAINGRGMLPVTDSLSVGQGTGEMPFMMTRTGSFRPDADGILRTESGLVLMGWPAGSAMDVSRDSAAALQPIKIASTPDAGDPTTRIDLGVNLPATETKAGASGAPLSVRVEYFGNLGTSDALDITYTPQISGTAGMSNTWTMEIRDSASIPAGSLVGSYRLVFDDTADQGGSLASVTRLSGGNYDAQTGLLDLTVAGGQIGMAIGLPGKPGGMRQLATSFAPTNITKDGSPIGNLASIEVDEKGQLKAIYDNGSFRTLYHIPLVDVPNPNGLQNVGGKAFKISPESGKFFLWDAGDGPTGSVQGFARETSTTDVAEELTHLIQTQRAYSSNAKIIQTVDEMLQETTNIKR